MRLFLLSLLVACSGSVDVPASLDGSGDSGDQQEIQENLYELEPSETHWVPKPLDTSTGLDTANASDSGRVESPNVDPTLVLVSDNGNERFLVLDPDSGEIYWSWNLNEQYPVICTPNERYECGTYGASHRLDSDTGEDLFTFTWHWMDLQAMVSIGSRVSRVERIRLGADGHEVDWSLRNLDFQTVMSESGICAQESPCEAPTDRSFGEWSACSMLMVHDVEIIHESPDEVEMWLADTGNSRAIRVRLPTDSTCGVVEEVVSGRTVSENEWDDFTWVNDVDVVDFAGEERLLLTTKGSSGFHGRGKITLWAPTDLGWTLEWEFPVRDTEGASYLNAPHNADWVHIDGQDYVVYAHSNGSGQSFEDKGWTPSEDFQGSVGVLEIGTEGPQYIGDFSLGSGLLGFTRDVDRMDDGTWLVTDSGCKGERYSYVQRGVIDLDVEVGGLHPASRLVQCPRRAGIRHFSMDISTFEPTGQDGRFDPTGASQTHLNLEELDTLWSSPRRCDLSAAYESDLILELGTGLAALQSAPVSICE